KNHPVGALGKAVKIMAKPGITKLFDNMSDIIPDLAVVTAITKLITLKDSLSQLKQIKLQKHNARSIAKDLAKLDIAIAINELVNAWKDAGEIDARYKITPIYDPRTDEQRSDIIGDTLLKTPASLQ